MGGPVPTVLVVDDDPSLRLLCRVNLEFEGYTVHEAATIEEARRTLASEVVNLVLLDVHVAGADGRDLLAELKRDRPGLPVALFTGSAEIGPDVRAIADRIVTKPFSLEELAAAARDLTATGYIPRR